MYRPHYKRRWLEAKHEAHMLRREIASTKARYSMVPRWVVWVCQLLSRAYKFVRSLGMGKIIWPTPGRKQTAKTNNT